LKHKKELQVLENVLITDIGSEGNALARVDNMVVFVPMLVPGDIVDITVKRKRKKYIEGSVLRYRQYSKDRIKAPCLHFGVCGGCKWQHLPYELQLRFKEKQVRDNLERIAKMSLPDVSPIIGSPETYRYRNKLEFAFSDRRWLTNEEILSDNEFSKEDAIGFHIPGHFDKVLDIRECLLQPEPSNLIRNAVREYAHKDRLTFFNPREQTGFLRNLIIRTSPTAGTMVIFVFFYEDKKRREGLLDFILGKFPQITSLMFIINSKRNDSLSDQKPVLYSGAGYLEEKMEQLKFRIGPLSFFQTNSKQAGVLYKVVRDLAGLSGKEVVYDLYTGTGTIANFVAGYASRVIGLEYMDEAVQDAIVNSEINGITNTRFFAGDIKTLLDSDFLDFNGRPDVIITDPPRGGMHEKVIRTIMNALPERILYISCNPATQSRDISLLSERYRIVAVQPVDMFPQTVHVENVVLLTRI
jgi:23S rRNA (uracil1939-C5)-methyltransferase